MDKIAFRIVIFLVPIFVVIGVIRLALNGFEGSFLPSVEDMQSAFSSFPNISADIQNAVVSFQNSPDSLQGIIGFFNVIGQVIAAPFRILGWIFSVLFGIDLSSTNTWSPIITVPIV